MDDTLFESRVGQARVDARDVLAEGVGALDALAGCVVVEHDVRGDELQEAVEIVRDPGVAVRLDEPP